MRHSERCELPCCFFFMVRRPPRSTRSGSSAASDVYRRQLFEAMAAGRPVIGARTGQVSGVLVDGSTGVFYNPGDATDLADKIAAVLDMADRGKTLGMAARQVATERYTWEHNACAIANVARTLVESRR